MFLNFNKNFFISSKILITIVSNCIIMRNLSNSKKLIFIDDDEMSNGLSKIIAKRAAPEFEVTTFSNPAEAMDYLLQFKESSTVENAEALVFLDINMPVVDGWMIMAALNKRYSKENVSFIIYILSSSIDVRDREKAAENELIEGYLYKPLLIDPLAELIANHMAQTGS